MLGLLAISTLQRSNFFTKRAANQLIPNKAYTIPDQTTRVFLARILLEETLETIKALGCFVQQNGPAVEEGFEVYPHDKDETEGICSIIDGAVDTMYVADGILAAMGVPDLPHIHEVCRANNSKFPNGIATLREDGKYLKPKNWKGPDHETIAGWYKHFSPVDIAAASTASILHKPPKRAEPGDL